MKIEQLLQDYNKSQDIDSSDYNDLNGFMIWLTQKGYRLNGVRAIEYDLKHYVHISQLMKWDNIILTNPSNEVKFDLIQLMQDKGLTFNEMNWLCINILEDIESLKTKQHENA